MDQIERMLSDMSKRFPDDVGKQWEEAWEELLATFFMALDNDQRLRVVAGIRAFLEVLEVWEDEEDE